MPVQMSGKKFCNLKKKGLIKREIIVRLSGELEIIMLNPILFPFVLLEKRPRHPMGRDLVWRLQLPVATHHDNTLC